MEEVSDFCFEYMDHTTKLCVAIPEGHIYAMVSTGGLAVRWSFGCLDDIETDKSGSSLRATPPWTLVITTISVIGWRRFATTWSERTVRSTRVR